MGLHVIHEDYQIIDEIWIVYIDSLLHLLRALHQSVRNSFPAKCFSVAFHEISIHFTRTQQNRFNMYEPCAPGLHECASGQKQLPAFCA